MSVPNYVSPDADDLGFSVSCPAAVIVESRKSYQQGFDAFLLGKSVTSGRNIFDRGAFSLGWRVAAIASSLPARF